MKKSVCARFMCIAVTVGQLSAADLVIPNGTKIICRLEQNLSSATVEQGQQVQLSVTENVKVDDVVVIPQGAPVLGTIVVAEPKRSMGRTGKLDFSVERVRAVDGDFVPLRYTLQKREGGSKGLSTGIMTAGAAVVFWPAAPFLLFRKGKDVTLNRGIVLEVFTDQDHTVRMLKAGNTPGVQTAPVPGAAPPSAAISTNTTSVSITSDIPGAEIEVDEGFVGSTPSVLKLAPGVHKISVKYGSTVWSRNLNVQPGADVNVNAILKK